MSDCQIFHRAHFTSFCCYLTEFIGGTQLKKASVNFVFARQIKQLQKRAYAAVMRLKLYKSHENHKKNKNPQKPKARSV